MEENKKDNKRESKLIALLKSFSAEDISEFKKYLKSPINNTQKKVIQLFEIFSKFFPELDSDQLGKENIYKKLFPGKPYTESTLTNLMFGLTKAAEGYLIHKQIYNDDLEYLLNLSRIYLDNKLHSHFLRTTQILDKALKPGFSVQKNFISKYRRLSLLKTIYYTEINDFENLIKVKKDYFKHSSINFVMDYIDILGNKTPAKATHNLILDSPYINAVTDCFDIDKFFDTIKKEDPKDPFINLSYCLLKMVQKPDKNENYDKLRDVFYDILKDDQEKSAEILLKSKDKKIKSGNKKSHLKDKSANPDDEGTRKINKNSEPEVFTPSFDREEKNMIFNHLINYCTQQYNKKYMIEALEVHKKMLEFEVYTETESDYMQVNIYRNIFLICSSVGEKDWLEYFIDNYSDKLTPEHRIDLRNLANAHLHFLKKNYDESLTLLSKVSEKINLFKTDIRNLKLKIFYELGRKDGAEDLAVSYYEFLLKSKNVTKDNKIYFKNFLNYFKKLINFKPDTKRVDISHMKSQIENEKKISNRFWLLEKIDELLGKHT